MNHAENVRTGRSNQTVNRIESPKKKRKEGETTLTKKGGGMMVNVNQATLRQSPFIKIRYVKPAKRRSSTLGRGR